MRVRVCLLIALALAVPAAAWGAIILDVVTMAKNEMEFSGTVSNRQAGETVEIEFRRCEFSGPWRVVGGATTASGGSWFVRIEHFIGLGSGSWRARWRDVTSTPVRHLYPLSYNASRIGVGRLSFNFILGDSTQYIGGRPVRLQRKTSGGSWVLLRTARLVRVRGFGYQFRATFVVRTRGLPVRVVVPGATAAPCFRAWVGPEVRVP